MLTTEGQETAHVDAGPHPDERGEAAGREARDAYPAPVQGLPPEGLAKITVPMAIILGDADSVAPPDTNGLVAARDIPHAELKVLAGVGHYDFLSTCTPAGFASVSICSSKVAQDPTHQAAIDMATGFFDKALGAP